MTPQYLRSPLDEGSESARAAEPAPFSLLDQIPGAVLLLDPVGRITYLNGIAELRLDAVRSELIGRDLFREVLPQLEAAGWGERFRAGMQGGSTALACEATLSLTDAESRLGLGIRSFSHGGTPGAVVLIEDRTALAAEEARRRRAEELAAVGELATGVAHEVNNPLASIKGFAQLLARDATDGSQMHALDIISRECSRIASIIDNLLSFAGQQRSRGREPLNLSQLVDELLDIRRYALETSGIEIQRDLDPELSPIFGERGALQRVVLALLSHAENSLGSRERDRCLIARTRESTDGVILYLMDNGAGIPRERLPHLFTRPEIGESARWVGLDVALSVVREHGGHISADSIEGQGTVFSLRLPRWEQTGASPAAARQPSVRGLPSRALRVLVADDEATLRLAIALFLERHGHEVVEAADAYEALRLAQEQRFDVVLADVRMPGDGLQLLERLETIPHLAGRTVMMTGDHTRFAPDSATSARPHLTKPFEMTEVIRLVESIGL